MSIFFAFPNQLLVPRYSSIVVFTIGRGRGSGTAVAIIWGKRLMSKTRSNVSPVSPSRRHHQPSGVRGIAWRGGGVLLWFPILPGRTCNMMRSSRSKLRNATRLTAEEKRREQGGRKWAGYSDRVLWRFWLQVSVAYISFFWGHQVNLFFFLRIRLWCCSWGCAKN